MDISRSDSTLTDLLIDEVLMDRMVRAVERVSDRLHRATGALESARIPYVVADDQAVRAWVARVDESAVRNTPDVDIILRRSDLDAADVVLSAAGFVSRVTDGTQMFLDGSSAKPRDAVHIIFAGENVRSEDFMPAPDVNESEVGPGFPVLALEPLVIVLLVSFRLKDRMHLRDMVDVGLVDETWLARLPDVLSSRLKELLDDPYR
jgi:hypothetical protein